ncbi:MAG: M23 family metallopeptidase [Ignavibacteriales bacterium]|nr:M23 family metallopeptidase [Ignavibacteriales bacterium]
MSGDQHHRSKKVRYDLLLVPRDDAGKAKSLRLAPWQFYALISGTLVFVVAIVLGLLVFTPVGTLIPIENPGLVNRYSKELVSLNERMTAVLQELILLREYNARLRNALGERAVVTDSGVAIVGNSKTEKPDTRKKEDRAQNLPDIVRPAATNSIAATRSVQSAPSENTRIVFPVILPTSGYITGGFDASRRHYGLDIAGSVGALVNAAADGFVVFSGWTSDDGNKVILSHPGGFLTFYKHNQSVLIAMNAHVRRGEPIALLGNSGETSAGPHVHFEIWRDGVPVDPANFILNLNF